MLLKQLVSICVIVSLATALEVKEFEENRNSASFCFTETPEKCLSKERNIRSIESPISNLVETIKSKLISEFTSIYTWASASGTQQETLIQCEDKSLVIGVVTATVSNLDKTRCSANKKQKLAESSGQECEEHEITTSIAVKMCNGRSKCLIQMTKEFSSGCDCSADKYLDIVYTCIKPTSTLIEHSIVNVKRKRRDTNELLTLRGGEGREGDRREGRERSDREEGRKPESRERSEYKKSYFDSKAKSIRAHESSMPDRYRSKSSKGGDNYKPSRNMGGTPSGEKYGKGDKPSGKSTVTPTRHRDSRGGRGGNVRGRSRFFDDYRFGPYDDYYGDYYYDDYYYYGDYYNDPFYYDYYGGYDYYGYDLYGGYGGGLDYYGYGGFGGGYGGFGAYY